MTDVQSPQCLTYAPTVWSCLQALYSYAKPVFLHMQALLPSASLTQFDMLD